MTPALEGQAGPGQEVARSLVEEGRCSQPPVYLITLQPGPENFVHFTCELYIVYLCTIQCYAQFFLIIMRNINIFTLPLGLGYGLKKNRDYSGNFGKLSKKTWTINSQADLRQQNVDPTCPWNMILMATYEWQQIPEYCELNSSQFPNFVSSSNQELNPAINLFYTSVQEMVQLL